MHFKLADLIKDKLFVNSYMLISSCFLTKSLMFISLGMQVQVSDSNCCSSVSRVRVVVLLFVLQTFYFNNFLELVHILQIVPVTQLISAELCHLVLHMLSVLFTGIARFTIYGIAG